MKQKDKEIIRLMRTGKRLNISEIARQLNLPISTVNDKIKRIEERYVIKRASLLDYQKLGYFANAKLVIRINSEFKQTFLNFLKQQSCVNSIYHINSGFDLLVDVVCKDAIVLKNFVEIIKRDFSADISLFQILKVEEKERFVPK
ncbi:Lrp/AsnC family transcriptional regulator [Candidatus Woesearchaeota archaeon]|nr:Lrp/AsnC family transcriptional regulator [Candidatus Woesearchaeota archaeon]